MSSFLVELRRPARILEENEKLLIGSWQEIYDPNNGFWNTFGNVVFSQKLSVNKLRYEFRKDHRFERINRDGEKLSGGVFFEDDKGVINLFYKYTPHENMSIRVEKDKLFFVGKRTETEYERVHN